MLLRLIIYLLTLLLLFVFSIMLLCVIGYGWLLVCLRVPALVVFTDRMLMMRWLFSAAVQILAQHIVFSYCIVHVLCIVDVLKVRIVDVLKERIVDVL